jgi:hypothetical protein
MMEKFPLCLVEVYSTFAWNAVVNLLTEHLLISVVVILLRNVQNAPIHYSLEPLRENRKKSKVNAMNDIISYRLLLGLTDSLFYCE